MPMVRDPACAPHSIRRSSRCSTGCRRNSRRPCQAGKDRRGPLRPHRTAGQAAHADARRGRGLQRRRERRPQGQGDAEAAPPTAASRSRAIDGNTSGSYGDGGQTHTAGRTPTTRGGRSISAARCPIESIVVWNRTDGNLGKRLDELHRHGARRRRARSCSSRPRTRRRRRRPSSRSAAASPERVIRKAAMFALTTRPRPGSRHLQGDRQVRQRRRPTAPPRCRRSPHPAARLAEGRGQAACSTP